MIALVRPWWGFNVNGDMAGDFGSTDADDQVLPDCTLIYAASVLAEHGHPLTILDSNALHWGDNELLQKVLELGPHRVFVKVEAPTCKKDLQFAGSIKRGLPEAAVFVFGACVGSLAPDVLERYPVDGVVTGDPSRVILEVSRGCEDGVWTRSHDSKASYATHTLETLDTLPSARYDLAPYPLYRRAEANPYVFTMTSLGCPNNCSHCPYVSVYGTRWRAKSAPRVVEELTSLSKLGIRYVQFRDALFTFDEQRVVDLCDRVCADGLDVQWACETRVDRLSESLVQKMAKAGCYQIHFGIESGSASIREQLGRHLCSDAQAQKAITWMRANGIEPYAFYMVGLPGETRQTIQSTIDLALALGCDCRCSPLYVYPNTRLGRSVLGTSSISLERLESYDYAQVVDTVCGLTAQEITTAKERFDREVVAAGLRLIPLVPAPSKRP